MLNYGNRGSGSFNRPRFFGRFSFFPPVIKYLLISNTVIWLLLGVFLTPFRVGGVPIFYVLSEYLALWPLGTNFWPWQLVTYLFLHGGFWHLFFNMFALWMFGMELEHAWGSKKFLLFYLLCGVAGGIANLIVAPMVGQAAPTVGASGAVFGVLLAFGMMYPDRPIYLYFLLPIRAKYFIAAYIGLELFFGVTSSADGVAHFAHLGGAAAGFLFILSERNIIPVRAWWARVRGLFPASSMPDSRFGRRGGGVREAKFYDITSGESRPEQGEISQEQIDEILDKINRAGYQSLTEEEKHILNEASKRFH
ncbi:MAG: rhomboid family intramembrane serine protease [Bacteroidota bacterium]